MKFIELIKDCILTIQCNKIAKKCSEKSLESAILLNEKFKMMTENEKENFVKNIIWRE